MFKIKLWPLTLALNQLITLFIDLTPSGSYLFSSMKIYFAENFAMIMTSHQLLGTSVTNRAKADSPMGSKDSNSDGSMLSARKWRCLCWKINFIWSHFIRLSGSAYESFCREFFYFLKSCNLTFGQNRTWHIKS